jgi:5-methylcytosine-specific restriction endonuclease McrA
MRVHDRSGGRCEICLRRLHLTAQHTHHRLMRSHGRNDGLANVLALCPGCHADVHDQRGNSVEHGWLIPSWEKRTPAQIPVLLQARWWLLLPDGGKAPTRRDREGTLVP